MNMYHQCMDTVTIFSHTHLVHCDVLKWSKEQHTEFWHVLVKIFTNSCETKHHNPHTVLLHVRQMTWTTPTQYYRKIWQFGSLALQLTNYNISHLHMNMQKSITKRLNLHPPIFLQWWFGARLPNLITANISGYIMVLILWAVDQASIPKVLKMAIKEE